MVTYIKNPLKKYLLWLHESTSKLIKYTSNISFENFLDEKYDEKRDAVGMQLQNCGELIKQIHDHYPHIH
jgi:uncharacterized protein with HEPN domain